ncbi:hypothetical protein DFS34DRAFT_600211 [Phlyctochytrium arcticum]|nr:hypothetical protein DFS34DRAFT_600211 [Phlyctochytrium arcticum]
MGVAGYWKWLEQRFSSALWQGRRQSRPFDHVLIDINHFLYICARRANTDIQFYKLLDNKLRSTLKTFRPTRSVFLAVDGPAPWSKLLTQRQRRLKSSARADEGFDLLRLTPGSKFMGEIDQHLERFACAYKGDSITANMDLVFSGSTVPGEGEVKVFYHARQIASERGKNSRDHYAVVGGDADIVIQALASPVPRVTIINPDAPFTFDMFKMGRELQRLFPNTDYERLRLDVAFLSILGGNDYLPKLGWTTFDTIFDAYLAWHESAKPGSGSLYIYCPMTQSIHLDTLRNVAQLVHKKSAPIIARAERRAAKDGAPDEAVTTNEPHVESFLTGLLWNINMYRNGLCPDFTFVHPSNRGPTAGQLIEWIDLFKKTTHLSTFTYVPITNASLHPLPARLCAPAVLPMSRMDLVPVEHHENMKQFNEAMEGAYSIGRIRTALRALITSSRPEDILFGVAGRVHRAYSNPLIKSQAHTINSANPIDGSISVSQDDLTKPALVPKPNRVLRDFVVKPWRRDAIGRFHLPVSSIDPLSWAYRMHCVECFPPRPSVRSSKNITPSTVQKNSPAFGRFAVPLPSKPEAEPQPVPEWSRIRTN